MAFVPSWDARKCSSNREVLKRAGKMQSDYDEQKEKADAEKARLNAGISALIKKLR
jgi:hypothetical protein